MSLLSLIFGDQNEKYIKTLSPLVEKINEYEKQISTLTDEQLKSKTIEFKNRLTQNETLDDILPEAFAVVREASKRTTGMRHFDVQLIGGIVLHRGEIAEMKTGEGKTLVATTAVYLNALAGKGVHVVTVNDYLARRDAVWMSQVYNFLGLSIGVIQHEKSFLYDESFKGSDVVDAGRDEQASYKVEDAYLRPCTRQEAYGADITYGTNNEFGFDYLRDNMAPTLSQKVQRGWSYAIVDEVDSILIDEARTPLIISAPAEESANLYGKFAGLVPQLEVNRDFNIDEKMKATTLTEAGINRIENMLGMGNIYTQGGMQMVHHLEQALRAHALFKKDVDYVVKDGEVIIIDEFTGRLMPGRRYSEGLHQAIEAKEGVEVKKESRTLATVSFQNYFRLYDKLAGMTGTAVTEAEEFNSIYKLDVTVIPTNKPIERKDLSDRIYATEMGKFKAVIEQIKQIHATGQPVLVGTISIEKNEFLSSLLKQAGITHNLLNAKHHEREAEIIAQAGRVGAVTIATNMAGRGVDIILGGAPFNKEEYDKVVKLGGLYILGTERHESRRIDNQLRGRAGRQGDPGVSQFSVSMEDDLMRIFGSDRVKGLMQRLGLPEDMPIENRMISNSIESAQKRVEGNNFDIRKHLVQYDDVINKQREAIYKKRDEILDLFENQPEKLSDKVMEMVEEELEQVVSFHTTESKSGEWNLKEVAEVTATIFPVPADLLDQLEKIKQDNYDKHDSVIKTFVLEHLMSLAKNAYAQLRKMVQEKQIQENTMALIEKEIMIRSIDNLWVDHLDAIDMLRKGIGLRGYAQRDPLVEYKAESRQMYMELLNLIQKQVVYSIYKLGMVSDFNMPEKNTKMVYSQPQNAGQFNDPYQTVERKENAVSKKVYSNAGGKVGRNDPCPCGSGKKYKKCCG